MTAEVVSLCEYRKKKEGRNYLPFLMLDQQKGTAP